MPNPNAIFRNDSSIASSTAATPLLLALNTLKYRLPNPSRVLGCQTVPGNRVHSVCQRSRVQVEEAHRATAVRVAGEQVRDIGAQLIVRRMTDCHPIDHHRYGRTINGYHGGGVVSAQPKLTPSTPEIVSPCPGVSIVTERFRSVGIIDRDCL